MDVFERPRCVTGANQPEKERTMPEIKRKRMTEEEFPLPLEQDIPSPDKPVWCIEGVDFAMPHPFPGALLLLHGGDPALENKHGRPVPPFTVPINGPTWADLKRAAEKAIRLAGDVDHVFIEGFHFVSRGRDVYVLPLAVGS